MANKPQKSRKTEFADPDEVRSTLARAKRILRCYGSLKLGEVRDLKTAVLRSLQRDSALFACGKLTEHRYREALIDYLRILGVDPGKDRAN